MIRAYRAEDAAAIAEIYNHYIANSVITFEEKRIDRAEIQSRAEKIFDQNLPWLIAEQESKIIGYAYATKWRERSAYRYTVESTVYLSATANIAGQGWGTKLYQALIEQLKKDGYHVMIGVVTLPNPASEALHEKLGMQKVAHFSEVGYKFDQWVDVGYWQLLL